MSTFAVEIRKIASVDIHPNANKLSLAKVEGLDYQFVTGLNEYQLGDLCVFFPIDSVLPLDLVKKIGLEGKLGGKQKDRVKTIKLRGSVSQGLCCKLSILPEASYKEGQDVTKLLGVLKYELDPDNAPNVKAPKSFWRKWAWKLGLIPRHSGKDRHPHASYYDIEGVQRYKAVIETLMDELVDVSEKLEGMNCSTVYEKGGHIAICSRNKTTYEIDRKVSLIQRLKNKIFQPKQKDCEHSEAVKNSKIIEGIETLRNTISGWKNAELIVWGEILGPKANGNIYGMSEHKMLVFDLQVNGVWISRTEFYKYCALAGFETAPIIVSGVTLRAYLNGKTALEVSDGESTYARLIKDQKILREGIVIRPMIERNVNKLGRLILKARSPAYQIEREDQ